LVLPVVLLAVSGATRQALSETIYYQTEKDGSIRLTNAPESPGYHTYLVTGTSPYGFSGAGLYGEHIGRAASRFGVDPDLVRAVIATESNFDPAAVSAKGARGLMQLMPSTASRFGVKDIFDPSQNIQGGVRYLRYLLDLFGGDLVLALAAYNAGEGVVQDRGRIPNYPETKMYVDRVLTLYGKGGVGRASGRSPRGGPKPSPGARKTPIYRTVSTDGSLAFSDTPVPKPIED